MGRLFADVKTTGQKFWQLEVAALEQESIPPVALLTRQRYSPG